MVWFTNLDLTENKIYAGCFNKMKNSFYKYVLNSFKFGIYIMFKAWSEKTSGSVQTWDRRGVHVTFGSECIV